MSLPVGDVEKRLVEARDLLHRAANTIYDQRKRCRCFSLVEKCLTCATALNTEHKIYEMLDGPLKFI